MPSSVEALIASGLLATKGAPAQAFQKCLGLTMGETGKVQVQSADENTSGPFKAKYGNCPFSVMLAMDRGLKQTRTSLCRLGNCATYPFFYRSNLQEVKWLCGPDFICGSGATGACQRKVRRAWLFAPEPHQCSQQMPQMKPHAMHAHAHAHAHARTHTHTVSNTVLQSPAGTCEVSETRRL